MRLVSIVIGKVTDLIQAVMRVPQVTDCLIGGNRPIVQDILPRKLAKTSQKPKRLPAQADTKAVSQKRTQKTALQTNGQRGNKQVTPAQPSSGQKPKRLPAQPTKQGKLPNKEQSRQTSQGRGKQSVTPAPQTHRHAKQTVKRKP